jgi:hypothetical protein
MRPLIVLTLALLSRPAVANVDCIAKIYTDSKISESKIELRKIQKGRDLTSYEGEKANYLYRAMVRNSQPAQVQELEIIERKTSLRTLSSYDRLLASTNATITAGLVTGGTAETGPMNGSKITCQVK